ncbi:MAG: GlsB/YeaQ/YmgE family stress response membrane protein [Actinomycetota bacterium]
MRGMLAEISFFRFLWYVALGAVIGVLARLILPGKQHMNFLFTILIGVVSAILGGFLWELVFTNHGIAWIGSVIVAVVITWAYERYTVTRT